MDQAANIWRVAEATVRDRGSSAYTYLCERAEVAKFIGDAESAISWWDIALATVEVMKERKAMACRVEMSRSPTTPSLPLCGVL